MADPHITVIERQGLGLATVIARKGQAGALAEAARAAFGAAPPAELGTTGHAGVVFVATAPGAWLAVRDQDPDGWPNDLARGLGPCASIADQSGGYIVLRIEGPHARTLLQRGVFIDLDIWPQGGAASTTIAHLSVILWALPDGKGYDVAVFRSFAVDFRHWLDETAATLEAAGEG